MNAENGGLVMEGNKISVGILTMSDTRAIGSGKVDLSGQKIKEMVETEGYSVVAYKLICDDFDEIKKSLIKMSNEGIHLILTTGGTGLSPRDNTPEATKSILDKEVPGISEAMRYHSLKITPRAMLSRGVSGIRKKTLIINLPGSPKAVQENLEYILPHLRHGIEVLRQEVQECGSENT